MSIEIETNADDLIQQEESRKNINSLLNTYLRLLALRCSSYRVGDSDNNKVQDLIADSVYDIQYILVENLAPGSTVFCLSPVCVYTLSNAKLWVRTVDPTTNADQYTEYATIIPVLSEKLFLEDTDSNYSTKIYLVEEENFLLKSMGIDEESLQAAIGEEENGDPSSLLGGL